jgi:hypothetical protein
MDRNQDLPLGKESDSRPNIFGYSSWNPKKSLVVDDMNR